jgi:hypothetical protein
MCAPIFGRSLLERSPEKPDVGFGSSYLNAFNPQDLGRCH